MPIKIGSNRLLGPRLDGQAQEITLAATAQLVKKGKAKPRQVRTPSGSFVIDALNRHEASKPECIVIHTTGGGLAERVRNGKYRGWRQRNPGAGDSTFAAGVWVYCHANDAAPHVLIGQGGELARLIDDELIAWHVGGADSKAYEKPLTGAAYAWWRARWPDLASPRDLCGGRLWRAGTCNALSLGVEVACPLDNPRGPWSEAAWLRLARQVIEWSVRYGIPIDEKYVFTHSDAHPIARTEKGRPYDPGPGQWPGFGVLAGYVEKVLQK